MADTTFVNQSTVIEAEWLNEVNNLVHTIFGDPANIGAVRTLLYPGITDNADATAITINIDETVDFTDNITLPDSKRIYLGSGSDMELFHSGSLGYLGCNTGDMFLRNTVDSGNIRIEADDSGGTTRLCGLFGGGSAGAYLYYGGNEVFRTSGSAQCTIGYGSTTNDAALKLGDVRSGNGNSFVDLIGDATYTTYGLRVIRYNTGANAVSELRHRGTGAFQLAAEEAASIILYTTNTERMRITSSGEVGIGETTPLGNLHVKSADSGGSANADADELVVEGSGNAGMTILSGASSTGILAFGDSSDNDVAKLQYGHSSNDMTLWTNAAERMRINSLGRVGIGTSIPDNVLHVFSTSAGTVAGDSNAPLVVENATECNIQILTSSGGSSRLMFGDVGSNNVGHIQYNHSDNTMRFRVNSTEELRIQDGGGISFNGDTAAANALDDYEEGTWTPVLSDGTNNATHSVQVGRYTKIGRQVHVKGRLTVSSKGSISGALRITGLPYTADSTTNTESSGVVSYAANLNIAAGEVLATTVAINSTQMDLWIWDAAGGVTAHDDTEMTATSLYVFEATYYV